MQGGDEGVRSGRRDAVRAKEMGITLKTSLGLTGKQRHTSEGEREKFLF